jgi:hypothetical protein|uniref:Uncharacterized protein n=1 Tax=Podoviridae sp. ctBev14 TaxID=2823556 RepID=A0A8S5LAP5_9CAUD|nr:MAG TPA: hypothetical protein [Podoviridae sp. ctBev14]
MKKYTVIHKDGSTEIINAKSAVKDAIAEGNIVIDEEFEVLNPILLTPESVNKFAILSSGNTPYTIGYCPNLEKSYIINGKLFDCFGHTRGLPTNPIDEDIHVVSILQYPIPRDSIISLINNLDSLDTVSLTNTINILGKLLGTK